jgi:YfiH family protein
MRLSTATAPGVKGPFAWHDSGAVLWLEAQLGPATAAFSTRLGGVSAGAYRSLNLGILTSDDRERVLENRRLLIGALGRDHAPVAMGRQVHGTEIELREKPLEADAPLRESDAQVTASPALTPLVLVADCIPLVLAAPGVVAAVHCGWRGTAGGIVERALAAVRGRAGGEVRAALGPGIGACCYEVGDEVRGAFTARGHDREVMPDGRLDLALAVRRQLEVEGVAADRIHACGLCTSCTPELFFSHRRDGAAGRPTGRQAGLAWLNS